MIDLSPYSLHTTPGGSDEYYRASAAFAQSWLDFTRSTLSRPVQGYLAWHTDPDLSFAEAAFEKLVLGVLLREHGADALNLAPVPACVLARLVEAQDQFPHPALEKPVKAIRGLIHDLVHPPERVDEGPVDELPFSGGAAPQVDRLIGWLSATGLSVQATHMARWRDYLHNLSDLGGLCGKKNFR